MFTRCCTTCSQSLFQRHANYILLGVSRSTNTILKEYNTPRKARCCRHITRIFRIGTQIRVYISSIKTHYKFMTWLNGNERFVFLGNGNNANIIIEAKKFRIWWNCICTWLRILCYIIRYFDINTICCKVTLYWKEFYDWIND